jgi:transpeptidase family protein/MecA-like transpeptidase family protein
MPQDDDDDGRTEAAEEAAQRFLNAWGGSLTPWEDGDLRMAAQATDNPGAAQSFLESLLLSLGPHSGSFYASDASEADDGAPDGALRIPFNARINLESGGEWSYNSAVVMLPTRGSGTGDKPEDWTVHWEPSLVHPQLKAGQTLSFTVNRPRQAPILAADGSPLAESGTVWQIELWPALLTDSDHAYEVLGEAGIDIADLAEEIAAADAYDRVQVGILSDEQYQQHAPDLESVAGLRIWQDTMLFARADGGLTGGFNPETGREGGGLANDHYIQLNEPAACTVEIVEQRSGEAARTLTECQANEVVLVGVPEGPLETTIDLEVQRAAESALERADRDGSIIAIQPSTGHVVAATGGLEDELAPGSTFTIVTAASLLESGVSPDEEVGCPATVTVDGDRIENRNGVNLDPDTTLHEAFAASCDTAFIANRNSIVESARDPFELWSDWRLGTPAFTYDAPDTADEGEYARQLVGRTTVRVSPLTMASVAATVAEGTFREPLLARQGERTAGRSEYRLLSNSTLEALRGMMRDAVTEGTASAVNGLPGQPHAVVGSGESIDGNYERVTSDWLVGFLADEDLAFAVVANSLTSADPDAGPIAADFLRNLG